MAIPNLYAALGASVVVFGLGFASGWKLQGFNVDAANARTEKVKADFQSYREEQARLTLQRELDAAHQREETDANWKKTLEGLKNDRKAFERCVAAGRCVDLQRLCVGQPHASTRTGGEAEALPPTREPDATRTDTVFATPGLAEECAVTTAQLNALQADIEKQPDYTP